MDLIIGNTYIYQGKTTKLVSKWAQGQWNTYTFADGRSFNGNPEPLFTSGELVAIGAPVLPPGKAADLSDPNWKRKKMHGELVETPEVLKEKGEHWQAPMSHPTQKEGREAQQHGKTT
jgi:hypothetical protein